MKQIYLFLFIGLLFVGCNSSKKLYQHGQYNQAVQESVRKLQRNPTKEKEITILQKSLPLANQKNLDRINFLRREDRPENWDEILRTYVKLKNRQDLVETVARNIPNGLSGYQYVNYDNFIIEAKKNSAEHFYQRGLKLMENGDKKSMRKANTEFKTVGKYYDNYKDIDALLHETRESGLSHALVSVQNNSSFNFDEVYFDGLLAIGVEKLNRGWTLYYTEETTDDLEYDFVIIAKITSVDVSQEQFKEKKYRETKKIRDGWKYEYDENGNVLKDSLGNDIKEKKYKRISCNVTETEQLKAAKVSGTIDFIDNYSGQVLATKPIIAENIFAHLYAVANGDLGALKKKTRRKLKNKPAAFPHNNDLIYGTKEPFRESIRKIVFANKHVIE